jgi:dephospho-CoA kinase
VVVAAPAVARARLMARNGLTEQDAQRRLDAQLSNADRVRHATRTVENDGNDVAVLGAHCAAAWDACLAAHPPRRPAAP